MERYLLEANVEIVKRFDTAAFNFKRLGPSTEPTSYDLLKSLLMQEGSIPDRRWAAVIEPLAKGIFGENTARAIVNREIEVIKMIGYNQKRYPHTRFPSVEELALNVQKVRR